MENISYLFEIGKPADLLNMKYHCAITGVPPRHTDIRSCIYCSLDFIYPRLKFRIFQSVEMYYILIKSCFFIRFFFSGNFNCLFNQIGPIH